MDPRLKRLQSWVETNSGSHNVAGLHAMADLLATRLRELPGTCQRIDLPATEQSDGSIITTGPALLHQFNPDAPLQILFSGHMDTVFGPDSPFQKVRICPDGTWSGPGIADMKGGLLILIESVAAFLAETPDSQIGGRILITPDEEIGSPCSTPLILQHATQCHLGMVFESALPNGELVANRMGTGTFQFKATGKAAHTGRDFEQGKNAIVALADCALRLHQLNKDLPTAICNVGFIAGGGPVNIVPDNSVLRINVRSGDNHTVAALETAFSEIAQTVMQAHPGVQISIDGSFARLPRVESHGCKLLHQLWNEAEQSLGLPLSGKRSTGGSSDGNLLAQCHLPHLDGVGIRGGKIHSTEEFAIVSGIDDQIQRTVAFLTLLNNRPDLAGRLRS